MSTVSDWGARYQSSHKARVFLYEEHNWRLLEGPGDPARSTATETAGCGGLWGDWGPRDQLLERQCLRPHTRVVPLVYIYSALMDHRGEQGKVIGTVYVCVSAESCAYAALSDWQCTYYVHVLVHMPPGNVCSVLLLVRPEDMELDKPCHHWVTEIGKVLPDILVQTKASPDK